MPQTPGSDIAQGLTQDIGQLNPITAILQYLAGMGAQPQQPAAPSPMTGVQSGQGMGGGSLRDRMLLEQRARQLSQPGGMGY